MKELPAVLRTNYISKNGEYFFHNPCPNATMVTWLTTTTTCCITGQAGCSGRDRLRSVPPEQPDGGGSRSEETGVQGSQVS